MVCYHSCVKSYYHKVYSETQNLQMRSLGRLGLERTCKSREKQRGICRSQIYGGNATMTLEFGGESPIAPMLLPPMLYIATYMYLGNGRYRISDPTGI